MIALTQTYVPEDILEKLEAVKTNDVDVKNIGVQQMTDMCHELIDGGCRFIHFYTCNQEASTA